MNNACGFFCLAMAHFITAYRGRTNDLYTDVDEFMDMFDDLNKSTNHLKNEYILKHFFRSSDPEERKKKPIEVGGSVVDPNSILSQDEDYVKV
jgi:hypothetical protein